MGGASAIAPWRQRASAASGASIAWSTISPGQTDGSAPSGSGNRKKRVSKRYGADSGVVSASTSQKRGASTSASNPSRTSRSPISPASSRRRRSSVAAGPTARPAVPRNTPVSSKTSRTPAATRAAVSASGAPLTGTCESSADTVPPGKAHRFAKARSRGERRTRSTVSPRVSITETAGRGGAGIVRGA